MNENFESAGESTFTYINNKNNSNNSKKKKQKKNILRPLYSKLEQNDFYTCSSVPWVLCPLYVEEIVQWVGFVVA